MNLSQTTSEFTQRKFNPSRGGHAPGQLRDALLEALEGPDPWWNNLERDFFSGRQQAAWDCMSPKQRGRWLIGQLWNCNDVLPGSVRSEMSDNFDVSVFTYSSLVRLLANELDTDRGSL
jgi:hypothetical protein